MNDLEIYKNNLKQLNGYSEMLYSGNYNTEYIVGKIKQYANALAQDAKHVDKQVKERNE